jgi:8-oxo-dGTP diphosphatase
MKHHAALLIKHNNTFLFAKRSKHKTTLPNIWAVPSGTQEENETLYETAQREAQEELGISIRPQETLTTITLPEFNVQLHFIICSILTGTPVIKDDTEIQELVWYTFEEFFNTHKDTDIGHGLIHLRQQKQLWYNI